MKSIKAALFDMDGVVVDNHRYHFRAWMEFSRKYDFFLNEEIYRTKFNGKTNTDLFHMIFGAVTPLEMQSFTDEKEGLYRELYREHMRAHTGLVDFMDYLRTKRIKMALGTSAPTKNVDFILDHLKLRDYFEVIVDGPQVSRGKPDPEVYLLCAHKLGVEPRDCWVFEDSLAGLEAGKRAGSTIIGVATSHEPYELMPQTDLIIHDFTEAMSLINI